MNGPSACIGAGHFSDEKREGVMVGRNKAGTELTWSQRETIRKEYGPLRGSGRPRKGDTRVTLQQLGDKYGVSAQAIRHILTHPKDSSKCSNYRSLHTHLLRRWGTARQYDCVDCDKQAAQWAYYWQDYLDERVSAEGWAWSPNPEHYAPLCVSCHRKLDNRIDKMKNK